MKMLLNHPRTQRELEHWAGNNTLIISRFFFWRSGDELQNSLTGLYRSILFEVLKECAELIPLVFPAAYRAFSSQTRDNCIEEAFFEPEDIQRAFDRLVSGSLPLGYRFCLFIDGLDEYGEDGRDRLEHEKLARSLSAWSQQNIIKIVVTSRPYVEFKAAFSPTRRIHLHEMVWFDIFSFAHDTLQKHRDFHRIEDDYDKLAARVADNSDGVFLWAAVTVRSLYSSITNHLDIFELHKQLEDTPKELDALYHSLLGLLSPRDRLRASKMLLMMHAFTKYNRVPDPCILSWVDEWDNPAFPLNLPPGPYSSEEYSQRAERVAAQIDGITNGLLELSTTRNYRGYISSRLPCPGKKGAPFVQFYHRTIRDFVVENSEMRATLAAHPEFDPDRTCARAFLCSVWFSNQPVGFQSPLCNLMRSIPQLPADMFSSFKRAWQLASRDQYYLRVTNSPTHFFWWRVNSPGPSFNHWAVSAWANLPDLELDRMVKEQRSDPRQKNWSLLLAAARGGKVEIVQKLLLRGCSPNEQVGISFFHNQMRRPAEAMQSSTTVWMAFCIHLVSSLDNWWTRCQAGRGLGWFLAERREADFQILELLIEAGGNPEVNFQYMLGLQDDPSTWRRGADMSLRQFVLWLAPQNEDRLMELMGGRPATPISDTPTSDSDSAASEPSEPNDRGWAGGVEIIEQTVTCGDETIECGGPSSGKPLLELPMW